MVSAERVSRGRSSATTFLIVDAQSVKNTDTAESKSYDMGKKVSGIKRTIAVDTQGLPHLISVNTANVTDRKAAAQAFETNKDEFKEVSTVLTDGGYTGENFAKAIKESIDAKVEVARRINECKSSQSMHTCLNANKCRS